MIPRHDNLASSSWPARPPAKAALALASLLAFFVAGCSEKPPVEVGLPPPGAEAGTDGVCIAGALAVPSPSPASCATDGGSAPSYGPSRPLGFGYEGIRDISPEAVAYLTFDDGPSDFTPEFLDILRSKNVLATFFVTARHLKQGGLDGFFETALGGTDVYRNVLKRVVDEGHILGNHTTDHKDLAGLSPAEAEAQLDENEMLINAALVKAGASPRPLTLVRPPFGAPWHNGKAVVTDVEGARDGIGRLIENRGINVLWDIDSTDSREWAQGESYTRRDVDPGVAAGAPTYAEKVARIADTVLGDPLVERRQGVIVLLHDTHNATRDALETIIDGLRAAGYSFGTIEDYAHARWGRPSWQLTPGPHIHDACVAAGDRGCALSGEHEVCGRFWSALQAFGTQEGASTGSALSPARTDSGWSQRFEEGSVELRPELPAPCNAAWRVR